MGFQGSLSFRTRFHSGELLCCCSYETADGVKVAEAGAQREIAAVEPNAESAGVPGAPMNTRLANTVSGGYSYTAPDGTYFNLR